MTLNSEILISAIFNGMLMGGIYVLLSVGLSMILGVLGTINLAHGDYMMLAMYITFWFFSIFLVNPFLCLVISLPAFFLIGALTQKLVIAPLKTIENQVLVTYGLAVLFENLVLAIWTSEHRSITSDYTKMRISFYFLNTSFLRVLAFFVSLGITFLLYIYITRTKSGKSILAVAQDKIGAELMGINTSNVHIRTFGIAIALAALAGVFLAQITFTFPLVGFHFTIIALVVVVLAGSGNIHGAVIGGLLIGIFESLTGVLLGVGYQEMIVFLIFALLILFKPEGLFGKTTG